MVCRHYLYFYSKSNFHSVNNYLNIEIVYLNKLIIQNLKKKEDGVAY